jgi:hypothetical protein
MLTGGHPNSLGRTVEVVDIILTDPPRLEDLYNCYFSTDEVVRLRTSNAMKRVAAVHPEWLALYIDRLLTEVAAIDQASAQWTIAQLCITLAPFMSQDQRARAIDVLKRNLDRSHDWIVLNTTMETLCLWAKGDPALADWLRPRLKERIDDPRKSVSGRARKLLKSLGV